MAKKANTQTFVLVVTFLLGLCVGFSACYGWFWFRAGGSPEEMLFGRPPADRDPPKVEPPEPEPKPDRLVEEVSEETTPETVEEDDSGLDALERVGDVWPARHLFLTVKGTSLTGRERASLDEMKPGGILLRAPNCQNETQTTSLVTAIKGAVGFGTGIADLPLVAVSQEGGDLNILNLEDAPSAADLGAARDQAAARKVGRTTAEACRSRGIGVIFAPVLDVVEPDAGLGMATRSFSKSYREVAAMGLAFADGAMAGGAIPVAKHYPGIGSIKKNPSDGLPVLGKDLEGMVIMYPFMVAAERGIPGIMVGHVAVPALDEADVPARPASLSSRLVRRNIRVKWGFDGVIVTDDLAVAAVTGSRTLEQGAVDALAAGCDAMVLVGSDTDRVRTVCRAIEKAVSDGKLEREQLAESKRRLDAWQAWLRKPGRLKGALPRLPPKMPVPPAPPPDTEPVTYTIQQGDSLIEIAAKFNVDVKDLMAWNGLKNRNDIKWGRTLTIHMPPDQSPAEPAAAPPEGDSERQPLES